jgi:hypothetical protein
MRIESAGRFAFCLILGASLVGWALPGAAAETCDHAGSAFARLGDDDESGIGGTGVIGVFGTITRTDRLCVNGLEIQIPDQLSILESSGAISEQSLKVGMVVRVRADSSEGGLVATHIQLHPDLAGQIEIIYSGGGEVVISGQRVQIADGARRANPQVSVEAGRWVVVHGLRDPSGRLIASRIEEGKPDQTRNERMSISNWLGERSDLRFVSIEGYLGGSRERPRLAGFDLTLDRPQADLRIEPGARIRVEARVTPDGLVLIGRPQRPSGPAWIEPQQRPAPSTDSPPDSPESPVHPQSTPKHHLPDRSSGTDKGRPPTSPTIDRPPHLPREVPRPIRPAMPPRPPRDAVPPRPTIDRPLQR